MISGYLTTSIILQSIDSHSFTFTGFYSRRIWRLQPAMIALMLATLALAAFFYLPQDFIQFLKSERYTSLFLSNQYFERSTTAYAADDTSSLLLLHTWSLAIEWQWYLVLPLGVWLLRRYCPPTAFKAAVLCLTLGATVLSLYLSSKFPDKSYYYFTARIFELLIGSCAVIFSANKIKLNSIWNNILGGAAVIALFYCATRENILLGFPDYHAVAVCLATALLLWRSGSGTSVTAKVLSFPPLVYIGTLSYSLYIWHWPVLAISSYLGFKHSTALTVSYFVLTFALAALSYVAIKRKFRKPRLGLKMTIGLLIVLPAIVLSALYASSVFKKNHYKYVLIGQIWDSYANASILTRPEDPRSPELSHQRFEVAIHHALNVIEEAGAVPIILKAMYPMPPGVNECLLQRYVMRGQLGSIERSESCKTVAREDLENPWINSVFAQLKVEYPNLVLIDPKDIQCDGGACETTVDGIPLYRDIGHMTDYASYNFGETYLSRFGNPMRVAQ